jgi:DNA-binding CsgD family transcriptional regulator
MRAPQESGLMRGREAEWDLAVGLLDRAKQGKGSVLLVEGEPGTGKSLLLANAYDLAGTLGLCRPAAAANELSRFTALAPLLVALSACETSSGADGPLAGVTPWSAGTVWARLAELATAGPVLVSIDDLHWADPATLHALRSLPGMLAPYPVSWILAKNTRGGSQEVEQLFDVLEHEGAARVRLQPLAEEALVALMGDVLGATPDRSLVELAACAAGNPFMLSEFLRGLLDECAIRITSGHASLISPRVPQRFHSLVQSRLTRLSPRTRQLLETGAVLGRSFRLEDIAAMLGESPGSLLAAVEEALSARMVIATPDAIAFQHDLVWRVVAGAVPRPVRRALHRQAGEMLLAQGGSAIPAAYHLLAGCRKGDQVVLAGLDRAAAEALRTSPGAAAELAVRALDLTLPADPRRSARTVTAVRTLSLAGLWDEADSLGRAALAVPVRGQTAASLRCALASLHAISGRPAEALVDAESILADRELSADVHDRAKIVMLQALISLRDNHKAAGVAKAILDAPSAAEGEAGAAALLVLALVMWDAGMADDALRLATAAVESQREESAQEQGFHPDLFLASRLIDIHRFSAAEAVVNSGDQFDAPAPISWAAASPDVLRARMALAAGRLDEAAAAAGLAISLASQAGTRLPNPMAQAILATVALRHGDVNAASRQLESLASPVDHFVLAHEAARSDLVRAQVEDANHGPAAALDTLAGVYADIREHRYLLMSDPVSAPWLVRVALAADDKKRANAVATAAAEIDRRNPAVPILHASAVHARGVLNSDRPSLERAVRHHDDPWARASAAEDLGTLLAADGSSADATRWLDAALGGYAETGAERDAARIRRRLRRLGIRRRHWSAAKRPATGWDSLTETERSTTELVAQGLTNQQVADQLFISVHTVAFHLRQVFRKLGIRSRVELARAALERSTSGGQRSAEQRSLPRAGGRRKLDGHANGSAPERYCTCVGGVRRQPVAGTRDAC